jgi:hypothetical protein
MHTKTTAPATVVPGSATVGVSPVHVLTDEARSALRATVALDPSINAASVVIEYSRQFGEQDFVALASTLRTSVEAVSASGTRPTEEMLLAQAHALQAIFTDLARRASVKIDPKHTEGYLRMALKAQNQCRMTLETLATIRNPPLVIARQANINNGGQQQVNNVGQPVRSAPVRQSGTDSFEKNRTIGAM